MYWVYTQTHGSFLAPQGKPKQTTTEGGGASPAHPVACACVRVCVCPHTHSTRAAACLYSRIHYPTAKLLCCVSFLDLGPKSYSGSARRNFSGLVVSPRGCSVTMLTSFINLCASVNHSPLWVFAPGNRGVNANRAAVELTAYAMHS